MLAEKLVGKIATVVSTPDYFSCLLAASTFSYGIIHIMLWYSQILSYITKKSVSISVY